jgi:hypothetical protein
MMANIPPDRSIHALNRVREAFQACLQRDEHLAQELLMYTRNELKRFTGDLPIVGHAGKDAPFLTGTFAEARAWGWLEFVSGAYQLWRERPGAALVHFKRAWRIWRPWNTNASQEAEQLEARREKVRAGLWLGEAWARVMSDRASQASNAILRAALTELDRIQAQDLLQETLAQQATLPPAPPGSPAYRQPAPYIRRLL